MYQIIFSSKAKKQYLKLEKSVQKRISNSLRRLRFNPERHLTKLVEIEAYRLRVGDYRLILELEKDRLIITIIQLEHRKNIYKKIV
ncbi:MAG: cytotoxic translational repressor of toxin-antitoxin stability system [Candidatus Diapherotrites archaeon CG10_big_fil_rev_8_21_14_0_10_31_34]|nr:MAG: cytotoxic translational repressor of toxin-antitoxin stability system [Candidatus Diapherotrites archaeon CG10_big_fil_rev_8_21_14_0_10_31_34]PJA21603.1 MAG: cytotoxic translational repressor of toxin-antitoxin stability system [Candidatus Diapherotrites archaeon CG_4_10_14_0_2_um_filter_31_5]